MFKEKAKILKKIAIACITVVANASCMNIPEVGITYQIINGTLPVAPERFQKGYKLEKKQDSDPKIDLGVFSLCYKNYGHLPNQLSFIRKYLKSTFKSLSKLPRGMTTCIVFVIDDTEKEVSFAIDDIIRTCNQFNKQNIPVYINWNGFNLGIQGARDSLLQLVRLFQTEYIFLADSDDILHQDCISIMYQTMLARPNLYLLLGEYTILAYLNHRPDDIKAYKNKQRSVDDFVVEDYFRDLSPDINTWEIIADLPIIQKSFNAQGIGNGYLPAMVRYFGQIPTECVEEKGDMFIWYRRIFNALAHSKISSVLRPIPAVLIPKNNESFLYFYRLHIHSHSHSDNPMSDYKKALNLFASFVSYINNHEIAVETAVGVLIKEFCLRWSDTDCEIDNINFNEIVDKYQKKIAQISDINIDYSKMPSFWKMVEELSNGNVDGAKNWVVQYRSSHPITKKYNIWSDDEDEEELI